MIWGDWFREVLTCSRRFAALQDSNDRMRLELERTRIKVDLAETKYKELRSQVMQMRVSQSTLKRAGWEVMCFIPEEVIEARQDGLCLKVARELVTLAIDGVNRVRANGTCCALVFEPLNMNEPPRAPRFVQALWDDHGEFKMSEKCWDQRTEEKRVRQAATGGFGV